MENSKNKNTGENNGHTVFHQAKAFINNRYKIYENIINNKFFIQSINTEQNAYSQLNLHDLFIEIQESGIKLSMDNLINILKSSYTEKINPIEQYFKNLSPWKPEDPDHIKEFTKYIKTSNDDWFYNQLKKWMVRAIKCVLIDKYFNKQALIIAQQGQNGGKTTLCRFLCPPELNEYKKENMDNLSNKDTKIELARNFLINLDELAIMSKQEDVKKLKSFMATDLINERLPYDRNNVTLPRRCSFVGSTDNFDFLKDRTGNVRWLVIELLNIEKPIDFEYSIKINIDSLWAQAYYLSKDENFNELMTNSEIRQNEENNEKYFIPNSETEIIKRELKQGGKEDEFMTASDILEYLRQVDNSYYHSLLAGVKPTHIGHALRQLSFIKDSGTIKKDNVSISLHGYYVKKLTKQIF